MPKRKRKPKKVAETEQQLLERPEIIASLRIVAAKHWLATARKAMCRGTPLDSLWYLEFCFDELKLAESYVQAIEDR